MSPNQLGFYTLLKKEVMRFWSVLGQTVTAPVLTALLYLLVFAQALSGRIVSGYDGISYTQFLLPGLVMMTVIQNAFSNTSSSLAQSKVNGNIVFLLMAPIGPVEMFLAYVGAALVRAFLVAVAMLVVAGPLVGLPVANPAALLAMFLLAGSALAALGIIAGIVSTKFDHLAAFSNFIITPLSFLSGVFYSVHSLPPFWHGVSRLNPFFYLIDGFRHGFFGQSDVSPWLSLGVVGAATAVVAALALHLLKTGYKIRH